ncbi:YtxH domain-containing protein [Catalinimonas niigatensis]|uniref:YtxH domain-containing protein n=1 Tax=Catalinimonas niigatensis TaxID=1397264 RepID=UPI002666B4E0|nr:YtxH domain-containing protein [Catalinimonas niigatensis]WPP51566.1 YtxH domain-containing protein [Catalinimonas niigatensis]
MRFGNNSFTLGRKKKKRFPSLEALKTISFVTGSALAMNKVLKEKILEQQRLLTKTKKKQTADDTPAIIAGFVGGLIAGGVTALLFAPESGGKLRDRVSSFFVSENGDFDLESEMEEARKNAEEKLGMNGNNS